MTNSYGWDTELLPAGFIKPYEDTILQGAVEGIGVYFSSGDNSDESQVVGYQTADWPASSPYVTAVGGRSRLLPSWLRCSPARTSGGDARVCAMLAAGVT